MTSFPGRLGPRSEAPGVEHLSRVTRVRVRGPAVSTSCPGRIGPVPVGPQYRPTVPGDSHPCPRAHGIDEPSRVTRACDRESAEVDQKSWAIRSHVRWPAELTSSPGRLWPGIEGLQHRPAILGDSGTGLNDRGVDPIARAPRAMVRQPAGSTSCSRCLVIMSECPGGLTCSPGRFGLVSDGQQGRPAVPGNKG